MSESTLQQSASKRLADYIKRIERLEEEKRGLAEGVKEIFELAKGAGFDVKAMKKILRERREDETKRRDFEMIVETYRNALGQLADTPLGVAAQPLTH